MGVWKRLDLALLSGTKGKEAVWGWRDVKVAEGRKTGEESGSQDVELGIEH